MENYVIIFKTFQEARRGLDDFCKVNPEVVKAVVGGPPWVVHTHNGNKFCFSINKPELLKGVKSQNIFVYDFDQHRFLPAGIKI